MYNNIKKIIKNIMPQSFIYKNEKALRRAISLMYLGNKFQCNLCDFKMSKFIENVRGNKLCPKCGSVSRSRRLWYVLENEIESKIMLHFSPSFKLSENIKNSNVKEYITSDYIGEFKADKQLDILDIDEPDNYFDVIVCYYVLEHIDLDNKAMLELYRILNENGVCYIQTPFKEGDIYEDNSIVSKEQRLMHFGQEDHLRIYSVSGLINRLEHVGFTTKAIHYNENNDNVFGFSNTETIIKAFKK
ncbi:class I SAM-dependent methyltransferase [Lacinutrix jangbogonensis]|uniref:class I SAM-dependent methyltransferase n=1 Tax=Lacinutrix jangbogonensis TaxID=1469557 RepID=UPI00053DFFB5|nr:methyltransferase domain-containing protein [Lacinutrix jangbogonensis]